MSSFFSWLIGKLKGVEEKPMSESDNNTSQIDDYDVFVSFRGKDIRYGFLSHLIESFENRQISTFVDEKLERGDEIWPSLVKAIKGSSISLIIFSEDYASSSWCLEELVKIHECRKIYGQIIIPVFYHIEPTHVRHQSSESYKIAFAEHERKYKSKVPIWRQALNKSTHLSGIESSKFRNDAKLLKEIENLVVTTLRKLRFRKLRSIKQRGEPRFSKGLVQIDESIEEVELLICTESNDDTRLIGVWGMAGIGKTTLAEEVFNKLHSEYEASYFLCDEREQSSKYGIISLKENLFTSLLGYGVKIYTPDSLPEDIVRRIGCMKVLIVLDDVNDSDHIEKLLGYLDNFGQGSRIIVTTRDEQVLKANKANEIYRLRELNFDKALELFSLNVFNKSDNQMEYNELSEKVVNYAQGIPLVVKALARLLRGKNKEVWESVIHKLKMVPPRKVYEVMKLSYDRLNYEEQQIFLDLACFFVRLHTQEKVGNLKSLLKDNNSDNSVDFGLERLKDKAFIIFSEDNFLSMGDSLRDMAWEIVRQESWKSGSYSRLWDPDDIYEALKNDKVNGAIRSIQIQLPSLKLQKLMPRMFAKMSKLKFLEISGNDNHDCYNQLLATKGFQFLAPELRFLYWDYYPLKSLPENFSAEELVILRLKNGRMEKLWDGVKNLVNLKEVDLSGSKKLKELPDLSKATNLEVLLLHCCSMLTTVHPSILSLGKLEKLDLYRCESLIIVASDSYSCSHCYLNLDCCGNQRESSSINNLDVSYCSKLQTIPDLPWSLKTLDARDCKSLKTVLFPSTAVEQLKENRTQVLFWNCLNLDQHSLVAIGLNAQINMMKFANQHYNDCDSDDYDYLENHLENYVDNHGSYKAVYVYPGSSVPEWLEYKTTKDYVIIDLASDPPSPLPGFIFCFVIGKHRQFIDTLVLYISISDGDCQGEKDSVRMYIDFLNSTIESDHVCVMYDQRCSAFLNRRAKIRTRVKIQVEIGFQFNKVTYIQPEQVLQFGVSQISTTTHNSFIQQIE